MFRVVLNSRQSACKYFPEATLIGKGPDTFFVLFTALDYRKLESAMAYCTTCSYEHKSVMFRVLTADLDEMKSLSNKVKSASVEPTVAVLSSLSGIETPMGRICKFFYKLRKNIRTDLIGCYSQNLFMENAAAKLNFSVVYPTAASARSPDNFLFLITRKVHYATVMLLFDDFGDERVQFSIIVSSFHYKTMVKYFLYCTKKPERESFSFLFWTIPMDNWTWASLGLATVSLTIMLRGHWFEIIAILMRQFCSVLDKKKMLIIFILATILFTYGYEGVISSFVTVPPPFKIFNTLKELLDGKYKIMISRYDRGGDKYFNTDIYHPMFKAENIKLNRSNMGLYFQPMRGSESYYGNILPNCNLTIAYTPELLDFWEYVMWKKHGNRGIRCYRASKIAGPLIRAKYTLFGVYHSHVMRALQVLFESGVLEMYTNFNVFVKSLYPRRLFEILEYEDGKPAPFTMNDSKLLSIFLIWGFGLLVSFLSVATEVVFMKIRKSRAVIKVFKIA